MNIVMIDDSEDDHLLFGMAIKKVVGAEIVKRFHDGAAAVDWWSKLDLEKREDIHVLLLDLKMPRLGGFEVLKWFQDNPAIMRPFIIVHSSSSMPEDVNKAMALGADRYMIKELDNQQLVMLLTALKKKL